MITRDQCPLRRRKSNVAVVVPMRIGERLSVEFGHQQQQPELLGRSGQRISKVRCGPVETVHRYDNRSGCVVTFGLKVENADRPLRARGGISKTERAPTTMHLMLPLRGAQ